MRIARAEMPGGEAVYGILDGDLFKPVAHSPFSGKAGWNAPCGLALPAAQIRLLAPCQPSKVVCVGRNYAEHAAEHGVDVPAEPLIFLKPPSSLIGPGGLIELPALSRHVEHEAELTVVIGKTARRLTEEDALAYVFGYTAANDVSARDLQRKDGQWSRAKGFDTFCPLGPWIETDLDWRDQEVRCTVNGELKQQGSTRDMVFGIPRLLAHVTAFMTLYPGDVLLTGTPSGVSPLAAGDRVVVSVSGIGELENKVISGY